MRSYCSRVVTLAAIAALGATAADAAPCPDVLLTPEQQAALATSQVSIVPPQGEAPIVYRCDTNDDQWVDITDIRNIALVRNQPSRHPDDPYDWDKNGVIDLLDVRGCQLACAADRCAPMPPDEPPPVVQVGGTNEVAECSQVEDFDNDGEVDQVIAISGLDEAAEARPSASANLELVIIRKVAGEVKVFKEPYAGKTTGTEVKLHLSKQPAGVVKLGPGTVQIDEAATIAYRNGKPKVLYFWEDGVLKRAPFGVDD